MSDKIVVLKNTKDGLAVDTVYNQSDSLFIDHKTNTTIEVPNDRFEVNTYPPPKDGLETFVSWASILGGIAGFIAVGIALIKLFQKDKEKQEQLNKMGGLVKAIEAQNGLIKDGNDNMRNYLIEVSKGSDSKLSGKLVKLEEQRLRLITKPAIWTNGGGYQGTDRTVNLSINNRGEICFLSKVDILDEEGFQKPNISSWSSPVAIEKGDSIRLRGSLAGSEVHPKDAKFKIRVHYHDQENYKYQSIIEWKGGKTELIETIELEKDE